MLSLFPQPQLMVDLQVNQNNDMMNVIILTRAVTYLKIWVEINIYVGYIYVGHITEGNVMVVNNFNEVVEKRGVFYGGDAGAKKAIIFDGEIWMLKLPKSTKEYNNPNVSYSSSPLSEYIGSQIYETFDIPVHKTILGERKGKIVVACKDFTYEKQQEVKRLIHFNELKNDFMSSDIDGYTGSGSGTLIEEVLVTINGQADLKEMSNVKERFWDMFVIDAFIGNNDRNNSNWGILKSNDTGNMELAPVFDNGSAFYSKRNIDQMEKSIDDETLMNSDAWKQPTCVYKSIGLDNRVHHVNPYTLIKRGYYDECNKAVVRFSKKLNMNKIQKIIDEIPEEINGVTVMSDIRKEFYLKIMDIRINDIFNPIVDKIL